MKTVKEETPVVLIREKPVMNYVLAVITLFQGGASRVVIKARGRAISRAVDVAEVARTRFLTDLAVKRVDVGTDAVDFKGRRISVSVVEIELERFVTSIQETPRSRMDTTHPEESKVRETLTFVRELDLVSLPRFRVVGNCVRYDESVRNQLKDLKQKIVDGLQRHANGQENYLIWGPLEAERAISSNSERAALTTLRKRTE